MSWLSFWVKVEDAGARLTLTIANFLTIMSVSQQFVSGLPKVSYIMAIDVWMLVCNIFVFSTILEYSVAQVELYKYIDISVNFFKIIFSMQIESSCSLKRGQRKKIK